MFGSAVRSEGGGTVDYDTIQSAYAKGHYLQKGMSPTVGDTVGLSEHLAETVSMVSFKNKSDKGNAKITTGSLMDLMLGLGGEIIDYDTYVGSGVQKESIPVVEKLLGV